MEHTSYCFWPASQYRSRSVANRAINGFLVVFTLLPFAIIAQPSPAFRQNKERTDSLLYRAEYEAAHQLVRSLYEHVNPSTAERFESYYLLGNVFRSSGQEPKASGYYKVADDALQEIDPDHPYRSVIQLRIAECYFNRNHYELAAIHARKALDMDGLSSAIEAHLPAVAWLILGHDAARAGKHREALAYFAKAESLYRQWGLLCELPLIYSKTAAVYHSLGSKARMRNEIKRAHAIADSCGVMVYKTMVITGEIELLEKDSNFKRAYGLLKDVSELNMEAEYERQRLSMQDLEAAFENRIERSEAETLRALNVKNEELLNKQRMALYAALVALTFLVLTLLFVVKLYRAKKMAKQEIDKVNAALEAKVEERTKSLEEANAKIKEDARMMGNQNAQMLDFCNIISHNVRAPLSNMQMLIRLLEDPHFAERREELMASMAPVVENLNQTCNELLESLQVVQDNERSMEWVAIGPAFAKNITNLQLNIDESGAMLHTNFAKAPEVKCPPAYLDSIAYNLISNAIKYRHPGRNPEIVCISKPHNDGVLLSVADNGLGIDMERHAKNVFRMRKVFHDHPEAKGFGLYLTKVQMEAIGGDIWVESEVGKGTTFFLHFKH